MLSLVATDVYLEVGKKKVFVCALDWPGWCRSAKTEEAALEALADYADRYRACTDAAGITFRPGGLNVVERLSGDGSTEFGVPGKVAAGDSRPLTAKQAARLADLVEAAWTVFDKVAAHAPALLRKGPRGGGRDRDKIVDHVNDAENAYCRKLGIEPAKRTIGEQRAAIVDFLRAARSGAPVADKKWPPRYGARRVAWHALDHAWEIEDRSAE
jgi:hypothetical protein